MVYVRGMIFTIDISHTKNPAKTKTISGYAIAAARDEFIVKFKY